MVLRRRRNTPGIYFNRPYTPVKYRVEKSFESERYVKRFVISCLFMIPAVCRAEGSSIGMGYPYISLKYDFPALAIEGRYVTVPGVQAYAGRGYWNFHSGNKLKGFTGLESGYIKFNTLNIRGAGYEVALFAGGEYSVAKNISLMMDFSPTLISLKSGDVNAGGVEYIINLGLYFHFGESRTMPATYSALIRDNVAAGRFFKAMEDIKRLEALFPEETRSAQQLRVCLDSAIEAILLLGEGSPRYNYVLGFRRYYESDWEAAVLRLKVALVSAPDNPEILKYLGAAKKKLKNRHRQPDKDNVRQTSPAPSDEDIRRAEELYYRAIRDYAEGKLEKSIESIRQGLILNPQSESLKNSLDRIEKEMKQK